MQHIILFLKVNLSKTMLYAIGVEPASLAEAAASIHCNAGVLPFKYLGLPVGTSMSRCAAWHPLIAKFQHKLSSWKASALSGR